MNVKTSILQFIETIIELCCLACHTNAYQNTHVSIGFTSFIFYNGLHNCCYCYCSQFVNKMQTTNILGFVHGICHGPT